MKMEQGNTENTITESELNKNTKTASDDAESTNNTADDPLKYQ